MPYSFAPPEWHDQIIEMLSDKDQPFYSQIATIDTHNKPHVRSVQTHYIDVYKTLGFSTHIKSAKWLQLLDKPFVSGCSYNQAGNLQIRWEANIKLMSHLNNPDSQEKQALQDIWQLMPADVRATYWDYFLKEHISGNFEQAVNIEEPCPQCGIVVCQPTRWDMLKVNTDDFGKSIRRVYTLGEDAWVGKKLHYLYG